MADVNVHELTVGEYLESWLAGKRALKPKAALYRDALNHYLIPHLGEIRILELRPITLIASTRRSRSESEDDR
jgi:hypothetical protein